MPAAYLAWCFLSGVVVGAVSAQYLHQGWMRLASCVAIVVINGAIPFVINLTK